MLPSEIELTDLLKKLVELKGSDLHLAATVPPKVRIAGRLRDLDGYPPLEGEDTKRLVDSILTDAQKATFEREMELDFSVALKGISRFRCNVHNQRNTVGAVIRA